MKKTFYGFIFAIVLGSIIWVVAVSISLPNWSDGETLTASRLNQINSLIEQAVSDANSEISSLKAEIESFRNRVSVLENQATEIQSGKILTSPLGNLEGWGSATNGFINFPTPFKNKPVVLVSECLTGDWTHIKVEFIQLNGFGWAASNIYRSHFNTFGYKRDYTTDLCWIAVDNK